MSDCLIVGGAAREFAAEILRTADTPVVCEVCTSTSEALARYSGQSVLFGSPDMVASILPELPAVDWVQSTWAGVRPLTLIDRRDYVLTGVKEVFGPQISEYVMGYLLAHELRVLERMEQQRMRNWSTTSSGVLQGKRLGVMGTGSIGMHIAQTARVFVERRRRRTGAVKACHLYTEDSGCLRDMRTNRTCTHNTEALSLQHT